jgi:4-hydroxybenzoate polyprenyltransferase
MVAERHAAVSAHNLTWPRRLLGVLESSRFTTRLWFDIIAPSTMLMALRDGPFPLKDAALLLTAAVLAHCGGTYHNDANDTDIDAASSEQSRNTRGSVTGWVLSGDLKAAGWALTVLALVPALFLPWQVLPLGILVVAALAMYNFGPVKLSARPFVIQTFVFPLVWIFMYMICGIVAHTNHWAAGAPYAVFVALFMGVGEGTTQDIRDIDNDTAGGRRTTPVVLGLRSSVTLAWFAQLLSVIPWAYFAFHHLPMTAALVGSVALAGWLTIFGVASKELLNSFNKSAARITHLGSICAFTAVNLSVFIGTALVPIT